MHEFAVLLGDHPKKETENEKYAGQAERFFVNPEALRGLIWRLRKYESPAEDQIGKALISAGDSYFKI